jgi:phosphatidate cytidylyltransferase
MTGKRVLTALVLIPAVVAIVLFASTAVVAIATALITILALREYFALGDAIGHRAYRVWTIFCSLLLIFAQWLRLNIQNVVTIANPSEMKVRLVQQNFFILALLTFLLLYIFGLATLTLWTKRPLIEALPSAGISSSGLLLIAFPLSFAVFLHGYAEQGPRLLLFALVVTWAADTTAYFVGRAIGKHPLAPHISPKKTWEGSIGGMIGSLAVAYAFSFLTRIPLIQLLIMAALGNIAGQMGDLLESAYKRSAGVKDSGGLLPGHGGVLDRIDALILCIPVIWFYLVIFNPRVS